MKRIKKFNENNLDLDYDYIYNCFAELIDDNKDSLDVKFRQYSFINPNEHLSHSFGELLLDLNKDKNSSSTLSICENFFIYYILRLINIFNFIF